MPMVEWQNNCLEIAHPPWWQTTAIDKDWSLALIILTFHEDAFERKIYVHRPEKPECQEIEKAYVEGPKTPKATYPAWENGLLMNPPVGIAY